MIVNNLRRGGAAVNEETDAVLHSPHHLAQPDYQKRREISETLTEKRIELKKVAHAGGQELARARQLDTDIGHGMRYLRDLSRRERSLLDKLNSGKLERVRDECDAAFGWKHQMRIDAGIAAGRLCRQ